MGIIGIIANPASGKDIRRLVSHATVIDNNEKINMVERIILAAQKFGVDKVYLMPDTFMIGEKVKDKLETMGILEAEILITETSINDSYLDTINASKYMEEHNVGCLVAIGGDGTCRAAAKGINRMPFIGLSTGTNNVYPEMFEATVVGVAAAVVASKKISLKSICHQDKLIEIYVNDKFKDIALVDAVVSLNNYIGARAIWKKEDIKIVVVARCHPASIGFSSIVGTMMIIDPKDDYGAVVEVNVDVNKIVVPFAAGTIESMNVGNPEKIFIDTSYKYFAAEKGTIALDGEREIVFKENDNIEFKITRNGPYKVDVKKAVEIAQMKGFFIEKGVGKWLKNY